MRAFSETLDIAHGIEYGTATGIVYGWNNVKIYILTNWEVEDCQGNPSWELTDFYIRPQGIKAAWSEASARGPMFYYTPNIAAQGRRCYNATGRFYFTKKSDKWRIHQIDGAKYFQDDKYKVP